MGALHVICGDDDFARKERARRCVEALLDGDIEGKKAILSWDGSLGYVDGGSAATSDCSQWTVAGVAKPQNYSFEVDTANKCIWLKNNKPGLILIVR